MYEYKLNKDFMVMKYLFTIHNTGIYKNDWEGNLA
jgi:hypothetical protein